MADHLLRSFVPDDRISWHETLTREGVPTMTDSPGSSLYRTSLAAIALIAEVRAGPAMPSCLCYASKTSGEERCLNLSSSVKCRAQDN